MFLGTDKRWILLVFAAVGVVALVLACVAITLSAVDKSASDDEIKRLNAEVKRLDEYQKRLQIIEQRLNIQDDAEKPDVYEIRPGDVFQISVHTDSHGRKYPAGNAIDSNDDTFMHTQRHTNPWWCADMQDIYHIKRVVVTNRKEVSQGVLDRSTNLRVGVTDTRPQVGKDLALDSYKLCAAEDGTMGPVGIVDCPDNVSGQYVIVQFEITEVMNIAEIQIYGYRDEL